MAAGEVPDPGEEADDGRLMARHEAERGRDA